MCVLWALLLCSVIQRWHGVGFTAMCTQCARSAHAVRTQCTRSAHAVQTLALRDPPPIAGVLRCFAIRAIYNDAQSFFFFACRTAPVIALVAVKLLPVTLQVPSITLQPSGGG